MAITTDTLRLRIRRLLADTGRGNSSNRKFFEDSEIGIAATAAREQFVGMLRGKPSQEAILSICRMATTSSGVEGAALPPDFFMLECGIGAATEFRYMPVEQVMVGEALQGLECIYADTEVFHGTATTAIYYKKPTTDLNAIGLLLQDFSEGFYNAVATLTAISLAKKSPRHFAGASLGYMDTPIDGSFIKELHTVFMKQAQTLL